MVIDGEKVKMTKLLKMETVMIVLVMKVAVILIVMTVIVIVMVPKLLLMEGEG